MVAGLGRRKAGRERGFTLVEIVLVVAILGLLIALAVPRYMAARKQAYKGEANNVLQQAVNLEWSYYQMYNAFDTTANGANLGLTVPGNLHWSNPAISGGANLITITMSGSVSPLKSTDSEWMTLSVNGTTTGGASF